MSWPGIHHVEGFDVLAEAAHGADADDEFHPERLQRPEVGADGQLGGQQAVADAVTGQEGHALPAVSTAEGGFEGADGYRIAGVAVWCRNAQLFDFGQLLHLVEAAAADDSGPDSLSHVS
jgi:hypothetical protein